MTDRVLISLEDVYLTFGGKPLFDGLRMHICEGDKICLVGKNGAGKTSLMKLVTGELEMDGGRRFCLPGITIGYLAQNVPFGAEENVHGFVMSGLPEADRTGWDIRRLRITRSESELNREDRTRSLPDFTRALCLVLSYNGVVVRTRFELAQSG